MKKYIAEFIGTFALVFCGTGAIIINERMNGALGLIGIAIAFVAIILAMIYTFGKISGAHINPAVTLGFLAANRFSRKEVLPYIISQVAGAFLAAVILKVLFPENRNLGATIPSGSYLEAFFLEFICTYLLMFVIVKVSHGSKEIGKWAAPAIVAAIFLDIIIAGPISGASMNPARSLAPGIISGNTNPLWLYIIAPIAGAVSASLTWRMLNTKKPS